MNDYEKLSLAALNLLCRGIGILMDSNAIANSLKLGGDEETTRRMILAHGKMLDDWNGTLLIQMELLEKAIGPTDHKGNGKPH